MTAAEMMLWQAVRGNKLDGLHFRRQQVIDGFVADFYCYSAGLIIEVDGEIHNAQVEEDRHRESAFALRGLRSLRFTNDRILNDLPHMPFGNPKRCEECRRIAMSHPFPRQVTEGAGG